MKANDTRNHTAGLTVWEKGYVIQRSDEVETQKSIKFSHHTNLYIYG